MVDDCLAIAAQYDIEFDPISFTCNTQIIGRKAIFECFFIITSVCNHQHEIPLLLGEWEYFAQKSLKVGNL
jgi:hypothetical protein